MKQIDIKELPFSYEGWVVMQPDGEWFFHGSEPELRDDCWIAHSNYTCCLSNAFNIAPVSDWTKSLIKVENKDE